MPSSDFEFFIFLFQAGSISSAAKELDITPAAASKRLANIERNIGCQLIRRSTRAMSLTPSGMLYLEYAQKITQEIERMNNALRQQIDEAEGQILINAPFGFGRRYIAGFVDGFVTENPRVECQLHLSDHPLNLVANSFDVGIRFGSLPDSGLHARKIASHQRFVCASPSYLEKHGEPEHPRDLASHNCIVLRQNEDTYGNWKFSDGDRMHHVRVRGNLSSNDGESVLSWALKGHGIAIRAEWDVHHHIQDGSLCRILKGFRLPNADIYAVYPYSRNLPARIRLFIDYVSERMKVIPFN